jgi:hypothetical protein
MRPTNRQDRVNPRQSLVREINQAIASPAAETPISAAKARNLSVCAIFAAKLGA